MGASTNRGAAPTALLFPGLGALSPSAALKAHPRWAPLSASVSAAISTILGPSCDHWGADGQRLIDRFIASVLLWGDVRDQLGPVVGIAAHSVGVYAACVAAGVWDVEAAAAALAHAIDCARRLAPPSTLVGVVGLKEADVAAVCADAGWWVAAYQGPLHQVVGGLGPHDGVLARLRQAGALSVRPLGLAHAYHTPLMAEASGELSRRLMEIPTAPPQAPIWPGCGDPARVITSEEEAAWAVAEQLAAPIRWPAAAEAIDASGAQQAVEIGEAPHLARMLRRCLGRGWPAVVSIDLRALSKGAKSC